MQPASKSGTLCVPAKQMESTGKSPRQLKLFHQENPLSARLGVEFFRSLPSVPGVYFFHGGADELLYIGQSSDLKARIGSYRHVTPEKNARRTLRLVHRIRRVVWRECQTAAEAVELERVLLLEHRPPFNRAGVWLGDPWWLSIEAREGKLHLALSRQQQEQGLGPLPSAFRHVLGAMARCLYRSAFATRSLAEYPHRLFEPVAPLKLMLSLPNSEELAELIKAYLSGNPADLLALLEGMPPALSLAEQEYWLEEMDRLKKYPMKTYVIPQRMAASPAQALADLLLF